MTPACTHYDLQRRGRRGSCEQRDIRDLAGHESWRGMYALLDAEGVGHD